MAIKHLNPINTAAILNHISALVNWQVFNSSVKCLRHYLLPKCAVKQKKVKAKGSSCLICLLPLLCYGTYLQNTAKFVVIHSFRTHTDTLSSLTTWHKAVENVGTCWTEATAHKHWLQTLPNPQRWAWNENQLFEVLEGILEFDEVTHFVFAHCHLHWFKNKKKNKHSHSDGNKYHRPLFY